MSLSNIRISEPAINVPPARILRFDPLHDLEQRTRRRTIIWLLDLLLLFQVFQANAQALHGMAATVDPLATRAALEVLKAGGNAIDAAVAAGFTLGVVNGQNSGIGGGCFMLIRCANGALVAIDGRESAPAAATRDMFAAHGKPNTELSQTGPLASGVPGALAAYEFAVRNYGRRQLAELILPAAQLAEKGFTISAEYARELKSVQDQLARFASSRAVFLRDGRTLAEGDKLCQPDLAATYRQIGRQGIDWFYRGPFARAVEAWMQENGGVLRASDFRDYQVREREPVRSTYRAYEVVSFPPPSSGGVHLVQILNLLEFFDLKSLDEATRLHVLAEAMKLAFADRAYWLGDPDFAKVPRGLIDKKYAAELARHISLEHSTRVATHGFPPNAQADVFGKHTTHFSVADADGNWVACTATINTSFGSKVVIPGTGVVMNNELDDFSIQPGVTNYFGLVGAEANAVAPGKRPLSSMSPTIILKDGQPIAALGAAGGPRIISTVALELVSMLDLNLSPQAAVARPRIHHQWSPDELVVEQTLPGMIRERLKELGHRLKETPTLSVSQIVARSPDGIGFIGAADLRVQGAAAGW